MSLARGFAVADNFGREEDQQLGAISHVVARFEQVTEIWYVSQERHFCNGFSVILLIDTADNDRASIFNQHLGLDLLGVDRAA